MLVFVNMMYSKFEDSIIPSRNSAKHLVFEWVCIPIKKKKKKSQHILFLYRFQGALLFQIKRRLFDHTLFQLPKSINRVSLLRSPRSHDLLWWFPDNFNDATHSKGLSILWCIRTDYCINSVDVFFFFLFWISFLLIALFYKIIYTRSNDQCCGACTYCDPFCNDPWLPVTWCIRFLISNNLENISL